MYYYLKNNKTGKILSRKFVRKETASSEAARLNWQSNFSNYTVVTKEPIKVPQVDNNRLKNKNCCLCGEPIPKGNTTLARDSSGELKPAHFDCITKQFATKAIDYVFGRV